MPVPVIFTGTCHKLSCMTVILCGMADQMVCQTHMYTSFDTYEQIETQRSLILKAFELQF